MALCVLYLPYGFPYFLIKPIPTENPISTTAVIGANALGAVQSELRRSFVDSSGGASAIMKTNYKSYIRA
ncbi:MULTISPECIES: hypothetical protein [Sphingobacterium]|uniref:hypothetical protein n=1 Tax=Sphingobacterium TaxID=28453 RepID=UPI0004256642|nr:hypothetical protein [Sphingobacterium sp. IITKGP-BTPF85]